MNDVLKRLLSPDDDGRAFTDAVLLRAAGALHRRRTAGATGGLAWTWLEAWARPWLIAAIIGLALALALPVGRGVTSSAPDTPTLAADLMGTSTGTSYVLAETLGN
jgi:Na+/H+-dicarboxylate symporter